MFSPFTVIIIFCLYMGLLFLVALIAEKKLLFGKPLGNSATVYALSLAVYCSAWTYYGSVGKAATSGMLFLTTYLGPTLGFLFLGVVLRRMIRLKTSCRITSIADFISARYDKSVFLAALVTLIAFFGIMPYIALQFKAVFSTFHLIINSVDTAALPIYRRYEYIVVGLMVLFTIIFGIRRLDSTERHQGMVAAVAVESVVKLIAFLAVGVFVTFFLFDGFGDVFARLSESRFHYLLETGGIDTPTLIVWNTYLFLSMFAVLFLPRQFHVAVVENSSEKHLRSAMWMFPLYLLLINLFVMPIAAGGLLKGYPVDEADKFVLLLPIRYGKPWLTLLVFLGGVSAAASMIMISSMTMATMMTNHILLPVVNWLPRLSALKHHLLKCRWAAVAAFILMGYWFNLLVVGQYMLVNIGMISFAAALQFAPAGLGGLFWRRGNKTGAALGLSAGFLVWFYTLLLPSFLRSVWQTSSLLRDGPWGLAFLHPERLFGIEMADPLVHTVFWSVFLNTSLYVLGSLYAPSRGEEQKNADDFVDILSAPSSFLCAVPQKPTVALSGKRLIIEQLFSHYFPVREVPSLTDRCVAGAGLEGKRKMTILDLAVLHGEAEKLLSGAIGSASAHRAVNEVPLFTEPESAELSNAYGEILARMRLTPEELRSNINYYQEREKLLTEHSRELEEKLGELESQVNQRRQAEDRIKYLSFHDKMTGLYNRAFLEEELNRLDGDRYLPLSVLMGDVNNLKLVNDAFGHGEGDKLLVRIAGILRASCRDGDIVARYGGDEFVVLLPNTNDRTALQIARRIKDGCNEVKENFVGPAISVGIATKECAETDVYTVLKEAEDRMYRNKLIESKSGRNAIISSLMKTLRERSHEAGDHTQRLEKLVLLMGHALNLPGSQLDELSLLSSLHDIGKIAVPDRILMKPGVLSPMEWAAMAKHCEVGYRIARSFEALSHIADAILAHHERWDGTGYPQGLKGEQIPLIARILSIADSYDVMTHDRPYKYALTSEEAIEEVKRNSGTQFDPDLVRIFAEKILPESSSAA